MASPGSLVLQPNGVGVSSQLQARACLPHSGARVRHSLKPHARNPRPRRFSASPSRVVTIERLSRVGARGSGAEAPPESREEAIEQAAEAVGAVLEKALRRRGPATVKQRREQQQARLRVEVPVLDDAPASLVALTLDLTSAVLAKSRSAPVISVFFPGAPHVALAQDRAARNVSVHSLGFESEAAGEVVVVAGAGYDDAERLQKLTREAAPRPVMVLNPEWAPEDERDATWGRLLASFDTAYAFVPLAIQGLFSTTEGALLKRAGAWIIFLKQEGGFSRLVSLKARPGADELQAALYNAMAANSPLTKSLKLLRGLISKE